MADLTASSSNPTVTWNDTDGAGVTNWRLRSGSGPLKLQRNLGGAGWNDFLSYSAPSGNTTVTLHHTSGDIDVVNDGSALVLDGDVVLDKSNPKLTLDASGTHTYAFESDGSSLTVKEDTSDVLDISSSGVEIASGTPLEFLGGTTMAIENTSSTVRLSKGGTAFVSFGRDTTGSPDVVEFKTVQTGDAMLLDASGKMDLLSGGTISLDGGSEVNLTADDGVNITAGSATSSASLDLFSGSAAGINAQIGTSGQSFKVKTSGSLLLAFIASLAEGATLTVAEDGSGDYATIGDALYHAESGDTVTVSAGTYSSSSGEDFPLFPPDGVALVGDEADEVWLDAGGAECGIYVLEGSVEASQITVANAEVGVCLESDATLSLFGVELMGNEVGMSGGYLVGQDVLVEPAVRESTSTAATVLQNACPALDGLYVLDEENAGLKTIGLHRGADCDSSFERSIERAIVIGGAVQVGDVPVENSLFLGGSGAGSDDVCVYGDSVSHSLVAGCTAAVALHAADVARNNIVAYNEGAGLEAETLAQGNLLFENVGGHFEGYDWQGSQGNQVDVDPAFRDFTEDSDWEADDFRLAEGSPAIDAASSTCPDQDLDGVARPQDGDGDGTAQCDIGPYEWGLVDQDGDGWFLEDDCDDKDEEINPDAIDIPYNGVDEDCDGSDLTDADQDGYDADHQGGDDCDDTDEDIHPGAWDIPDNGVDEDCDGQDASDSDGDGWPDQQDCAEEDDSVHPTATELCDGRDQDCDDAVDEGACDTGVQDSGIGDSGEVPRPGGCDCSHANDGRSAGLLLLFLWPAVRRKVLV